MKNYKSVVTFVKFAECQVPLCKYKAPCWKLPGDGSGLNLTSFRATVSLRSISLAVWKSNKHVNGGPSSNRWRNRGGAWA